MNVLIWMVAGGLIGWLANQILNTEGRQENVLNVVLGIAGASIGGWVLSAMLGISTHENVFSMPGLLVALAGAIALLGIVKFLRTYHLVW